MEQQNIEIAQMGVKPVASILKALNIGESEVFGLEQGDSVRTTIQRVKDKYNRRFSTHKEGRTIIVTRTE